jgi:hypothetical protein
MSNTCYRQPLQRGNGQAVTLHQHLLHGMLLILWQCGEGKAQVAHVFGKGDAGSKPDGQISIHPPPLVVAIIVDRFIIVDIVKEGDHACGPPHDKGVHKERTPSIMPGHSHQEVLDAMPPNLTVANLLNFPFQDFRANNQVHQRHPTDGVVQQQLTLQPLGEFPIAV